MFSRRKLPMANGWTSAAMIGGARALGAQTADEVASLLAREHAR
jgi:hypothetical protein